jgi:type II secretory pathway component PulJ
MVCKITFTKRPGLRGLSLAEMMIATAIGSIVVLLISVLMLYSGRSFAAMANYVDLDHYSQQALDQMSRDIRQVSRVLAHTEHHLTFENADGSRLTYDYNPETRRLVRSLNGQPDPKPLLVECDFLQFMIFQRNPIGGRYDQYPAADPATAKLVQLAWVCSRTILGVRVNTESVQSAKIVIRNR